jgi:hypothetical protein
MVMMMTTVAAAAGGRSQRSLARDGDGRWRRCVGLLTVLCFDLFGRFSFFRANALDRSSQADIDHRSDQHTDIQTTSTYYI